MLLKSYVKGEMALNALKSHLQRLRDDESGASLVEYSLLIGLITVAVVATIVLVGKWVGKQWTDLQTAVGA